MAYSWLSFGQAKQELANALSDPLKVRWVDEELGLYIIASLREWNTMTWVWRERFVFNLPSTIGASSGLAAPVWNHLGVIVGSPRFRSISDVDMFKFVEYQLGEPASGGVWTGTSQFNINDLATALNRYRDDLIQASSCNTQIVNLPAPPNITNTQIPDGILEVQRVRWMPIQGSPVTLWRDDALGEAYYNPGYEQDPPGVPSEFDVSGQPLEMVVTVPPGNPGYYELAALLSGGSSTPPAANPLNIPDDFEWVLRNGILADLMARESESTDRPRAEHCQQRYEDGVKLMQNTPWIFLAKVNGVTVDTPSMAEMDGYAPEWDTPPSPTDSLVIGGIDFFSVTPLNPDLSQTSVELTVLANAPVPSSDTDFLQVSRDTWESILDHAHYLALFVLGGYEFSGAQELERRFIAAAGKENLRLQKMGLFNDVFDLESSRQSREEVDDTPVNK